MFEALDMTRFKGSPVGIATGGTSQERAISLKTGRAFEKALRARNYDVTVFDVATDLGDMVASRPEAMLLGIHGGLGESGALQGFLESLQIPYTGSGVLASALAMDKERARIVCDAAGVPVAPGIWVDPSGLSQAEAVANKVAEQLDFPVVAKLNDSGSSFGVHICNDHAQLVTALRALVADVGSAASSGVVIERFIEGPEYTVGFFDHRCLGVVEIRPEEGFYDFEAKYESSETDYAVVSDESICVPLIEWSKMALEALGCRGVARVDFKGRPEDKGAVAMLEVNTIPGMTTTSLVPKLAANKGVPFEEFVEAMLAAAGLDGT